MNSLPFGPEKNMKLREPLDTWLSAGLRDFAVPEAAGSSARVFSLDYPPLNGDYADYPVIKVMRPDKTQYALPLFETETRILTIMGDVPGITPLLGFGFLEVTEGQWPGEIAPLSTSLEKKASAAHLAGNADLFSPAEHEVFLSEIRDRAADSWLAFLILPRRWEDNLYLRCDAGYTRGEYSRNFPVLNALKAAHQICDIIQCAHNRDIVYLDHKVLHYYWNEPRQQVFALDWNIGRQITDNNSREVYEFDLLQFSARAFHHLMTGRQAPGSVKVGPNKPEDIHNAPEKYDPIWTFDDQERLTQDELSVLGDAIQGKYKFPGDLSEDLQRLLADRQSQV